VLPRPDETADVIVGRRYKFAIYTHCGVKFIGLDGSVWKASPALGDGNVPAGWNGLQRGVIEILSNDRALFTDRSGHEVLFLRRSRHPGAGCA